MSKLSSNCAEAESYRTIIVRTVSRKMFENSAITTGRKNAVPQVVLNSQASCRHHETYPGIGYIGKSIFYDGSGRRSVSIKNPRRFDEFPRLTLFRHLGLPCADRGHDSSDTKNLSVNSV